MWRWCGRLCAQNSEQTGQIFMALIKEQTALLSKKRSSPEGLDHQCLPSPSALLPSLLAQLTLFPVRFGAGASGCLPATRTETLLGPFRHLLLPASTVLQPTQTILGHEPLQSA